MKELHLNRCNIFLCSYNSSDCRWFS